MGRKNLKNGDWWSFGIINGRLAEFHYEVKNRKFRITYGHCYVKREEYKTKAEQKMIAADTKKYRFTYRNQKYKHVGDGRFNLGGGLKTLAEAYLPQAFFCGRFNLGGGLSKPVYLLVLAFLYGVKGKKD